MWTVSQPHNKTLQKKQKDNDKFATSLPYLPLRRWEGK